ncbi:WD repeat and HMG-box DNA-binding protein 1-like [Acropora muricata]|uniref:WD repeat and HMG-box DNA-binding protein 1-like n=1 Tax=Acropora muricata TaxID=159855 RepID=UPI0034E5DB7E
MPVDRKPMRFAHSEGHTDVCYDENGDYLLTCGSDGDVRIYKDFDDSDPKSFRVGDHVTVLAVKNEKIVTASDNAVQAFTFPEGSPDGILTRFTAPVNHLCFNQSGTVLAAGSSDFNVKVVTIADGSQRLLKGHTAPVLSVTIDPKDQYIASSSCDGTVKIWKLEDQSCLTTLSILPKVNDSRISKTMCRLSWQPMSGKYLAVPVDKGIKIYERNSWENIFNLDDGSHSELVSIVSWSPCGNYIASSSICGEIFIWKLSSKTVIERINHESKQAISGLVWNPRGNRELAYTDNQGQFGVCEGVISKEDEQEDGNNNIAASNHSMDDSLLATAVDGDSDDEQLIIAKKKQKKSNAWIDEEAEDDDDDDDEFKDIRKLKAVLAAPLDFGDGENDVDGDTASEVSAQPTAKKEVIHTPYVPTLQPAFQPSATPAHLMHRFMVWNSVGIVRCHKEDEISSIEVEFHDASTHHPLHLTNHLNHTMAALSSTALLLACKVQDDMTSKLVCIHFGSWDNSKEWTVEMPAEESIQTVAVGSSFVAVTTNKRFLRVFTIGGVQRHVFSLPGPVVCTSGRDCQLMVVYHLDNPIPGEQALAAKFLDLRENIITEERVTLSEKSTLSWVGFTENLTPVTVDSAGVVRMLSRSFGSSIWSPVCMTKSNMKNKSDNYWVVGLDEKNQQIRCIYCKGSSYPPTLPRPVLVLLPLQLPLCEIATEKGQLEEAYLRSQLLFGDEEGDSESASRIKTAEIQGIMKLFALACKSDREFRAVELCELLPDAHSVSLAIKYAALTRRMNLANRLDALARQKAGLETAEEFEDELPEPGPPIRQGHKRTQSNRPGRYCRTVSRPEQSGEEEEMEEDEMEENGMVDNGLDENLGEESDTPSGEERRSLANLNNRDSRSNHVVKQPRPPPSPAPSHSSSQGRSNPFRVGSQSNKTAGKSFFDSVEEEKKSLMNRNKISPESKPGQKKKGKQTTLLKRQSRKEQQAADVITLSEEEQKSQKKSVKKNGFNLWYEENKESLLEAESTLSDTELIKLAMRKWKSLGDGEKSEWNEKAKDTAIRRDDRDDLKKRKRKTCEDENEDTSNTLNVAKRKAKEISTGGTTTKLAGFVYKKD